MFRILIYILFALIFSGLVGCSGRSASDNSNLANANANYDASEFTDAKAALDEGSRLLDLGDADRAIIVLNRAVALDPDLAEGYFKLGIAYSLVETRDAAIVDQQVTPTPLPGDPTPKPKRTNSYKAFEKAVEAYKKLIEASPEDHAAYYNLGRAYNKLNEDEAAARAFRQAVKLNPEDTEYQTDLGAILVKLAQYREAIGPLNKAIELDPENARAIDLLDDAEAGRKRVDFTPPKNDNRASNSANSNTDSNTETPPSNTDTAKTPKPVSTHTNTKPPPTPKQR